MIELHFCVHDVEAKLVSTESRRLGSHPSSAALPRLMTVVDDFTSLGHGFLICNMEITTVCSL